MDIFVTCSLGAAEPLGKFVTPATSHNFVRGRRHESIYMKGDVLVEYGQELREFGLLHKAHEQRVRLRTDLYDETLISYATS